MQDDRFESYLLKRRATADGYEPLTDDFSDKHPDDDYPPMWAYGPWWADAVFIAYLFVRTALVFMYYRDDIVSTNVWRALWCLLLAVAIIVAIVRFRERRRWRLPKNLRPPVP